MQTAYWMMVMMMVWITAPLSEGGQLNDVIRGLVPDNLAPQLVLQSLDSRRHPHGIRQDGAQICIWKICPPSPWRRLGS
uniref:Consomatin Te1 n=1 Tax=Conus terebra TaxID=89453 RepID=CSST1_CONTC|nr:RecName: Full=Consomatin Te1; Short=ConSST Te1; AltName: Full=Somatostatin-related peptide; Short=SSRP; Flags: Precursor [Conus terebra]